MPAHTSAESRTLTTKSRRDAMFTFTRRLNVIAQRPPPEVYPKCISITRTSFNSNVSLPLTETSYLDVTSDMSDVEDTNKVLLEKHTREIAARIRRSPNVYDSSTSLERPVFATPISDRTITENSASVKFTCSVLSSDCEISWEKNGFPIRTTSKYQQTFADGLAILEIFDVNDDDAGKYNCVASNKFGESITSAKLKVYSGFKPTVSMPPIVTRQMKGRMNHSAGGHHLYSLSFLFFHTLNCYTIIHIHPHLCPPLSFSLLSLLLFSTFFRSLLFQAENVPAKSFSRSIKFQFFSPSNA